MSKYRITISTKDVTFQLIANSWEGAETLTNLLEGNPDVYLVDAVRLRED